jgi:hypothetical protein
MPAVRRRTSTVGQQRTPKSRNRCRKAAVSAVNAILELEVVRPTLTLGFSRLTGWRIGDHLRADEDEGCRIDYGVGTLAPTPPAGVVLNVTNGSETSTTRDGEDTLTLPPSSPGSHVTIL